MKSESRISKGTQFWIFGICKSREEIGKVRPLDTTILKFLYLIGVKVVVKIIIITR